MFLIINIQVYNQLSNEENSVLFPPLTPVAISSVKSTEINMLMIEARTWILLSQPHMDLNKTLGCSTTAMH